MRKISLLLLVLGFAGLTGCGEEDNGGANDPVYDSYQEKAGTYLLSLGQLNGSCDGSVYSSPARNNVLQVTISVTGDVSAGYQLLMQFDGGLSGLQATGVVLNDSLTGGNVANDASYRYMIGFSRVDFLTLYSASTSTISGFEYNYVFIDNISYSTSGFTGYLNVSKYLGLVYCNENASVTAVKL